MSNLPSTRRRPRPWGARGWTRGSISNAYGSAHRFTRSAEAANDAIAWHSHVDAGMDHHGHGASGTAEDDDIDDIALTTEDEHVAEIYQRKLHKLKSSHSARSMGMLRSYSSTPQDEGGGVMGEARAADHLPCPTEEEAEEEGVGEKENRPRQSLLDMPSVVGGPPRSGASAAAASSSRSYSCMVACNSSMIAC